MSAPSYQFRPGGFEDDEDSDEDGFYMDSISQEELPNKRSNAIPAESRYVPSGKGGFGTPKPKPADKRQFKRSSGNRRTQEPVKTLSITDFQNAVVRGNLPAVKNILDEGLAVDTVLPAGWTGLMYSVSCANVEVAKLLLDRGANPEFNKDKYTVLMAACGASGYKEEEVLKCVDLLIDKGSEVNVYDRYHMSPLMYAAREGRCRVIERLVQAGASVDKQDTRGWTCLTWAVSKGHSAAVKTLLSCKADPKKKHCDGGTAVDIAYSDEIIELLGGEPSGEVKQPLVALAAGESGGAVNSSVIPNSSGNAAGLSNGSSSSNQYGTTYGELELFLCGLDLNQLVPLFQAQHVEFSTFLRLTEEDLIKMGISQIGVRKKILDGILAVHKKEWDKSSLISMQYNKHISCAESIAMVANISKHSKYITTTIGFIQDQIRKYPAVVEELQDGTGPKQLHQHLIDTQRNVQTLHTQLDAMKTQLEKILQKGNYEPPDLLYKDKIKTTGSRLRIVGFVCTSALVITALWKRQFIFDKVWLLFPEYKT